MIQCKWLGQSGFRIAYSDVILYIDPYLTDSIAKGEGTHLSRQTPVKYEPEKILDADWVLVTHAHQDHCDIETLLPIYHASPHSRFAGGKEVLDVLIGAGFDSRRLIHAGNNWINITKGLRIHATPAAHPAIVKDNRGGWNCNGYIMDFGAKRCYHSGDTFVTGELLDFMKEFYPIEVAMLPVNEHNYFRENLNILGNMGIRDAFSFAEEIGASKLVPMHWDMFKLNAAFREEIELLYSLLQPPFDLIFDPHQL